MKYIPRFPNLPKSKANFTLINTPPCIGAENLQETARSCYGHLVYKKVWEQLGIGEIIKKCAKGTRIKFDIEKAIFYCVVHHILTKT